jgi:hypothetical protein
MILIGHLFEQVLRMMQAQHSMNSIPRRILRASSSKNIDDPRAQIRHDIGVCIFELNQLENSMAHLRKSRRFNPASGIDEDHQGGSNAALLIHINYANDVIFGHTIFGSESAIVNLSIVPSSACSTHVQQSRSIPLGPSLRWDQSFLFTQLKTTRASLSIEIIHEGRFGFFEVIAQAIVPFRHWDNQRVMTTQVPLRTTDGFLNGSINFQATLSFSKVFKESTTLHYHIYIYIYIVASSIAPKQSRGGN